jgi:hypothetical protein
MMTLFKRGKSFEHHFFIVDSLCYSISIYFFKVSITVVNTTTVDECDCCVVLSMSFFGYVDEKESVCCFFC